MGGASIFGGQDLAVKFGLEKNRKLEEEALANKETEKLNERELDEGDLFGVRAIERGYFGGVSQSRTNSPAQSMFSPTPSTSVVDLSTPDPYKIVPSRTPSPEAGPLNPPTPSRRSSESSQTKSKHKPSPLNLEPTGSTARAHQPIASTSTLNVPSNRPTSDISISSPTAGNIQQNYHYVSTGSHANIKSQVGLLVHSAEPSPSSQYSSTKSPTPPPATYVPNTLPSRTSPPPQIPVPPLPSPYLPDSSITINGLEQQVQVYQCYSPTNPTTSTSQKTHHHHKNSTTSSLYSSSSSSSSPSRKSIARTHDSIKHAHKKSSASSVRDASANASGNAIERERDHIHYDPATRSPLTGKMQGRPVDFDSRRESPFGGAGADDLV
ncbi:hypothetical protein ACMFMG_002055 [Clarireedia jacksonii]